MPRRRGGTWHVILFVESFHSRTLGGAHETRVSGDDRLERHGVRGDVQLHRSRLDHRDRGEPDAVAGGVRGRRLRGRPAGRGQRERLRRGRRGIVGGWLCDRYGRKFIYTYDLLVYMVGVLLAAFAVSYSDAAGRLPVTGLAVGAGVPASWTYIAEEAPADGAPSTSAPPSWPGRSARWSASRWPSLVVPLGLLGSRLIFLHLFVVAFVTWWLRQGLRESPSGPRSRTRPAERRAPRRRCAPCSARRRNITALLFLFGVYGFWNLVAGQAGIFMPRVYDAAGLASRRPERAPGAGLGLHGPGDLVRLHALRRPDEPAHAVRRRRRRWASWPGPCSSYAPGSLPVLLVFAVVWGTSAGIGAQAFYSVWTSELFATRYRATAQGVLFFAARVRRRAAQLRLPDPAGRAGRPVRRHPDARLPGRRSGRRRRLGTGHPGQVAAPRSSGSGTTRAASPTLSTRGRDRSQTSLSRASPASPGPRWVCRRSSDVVQLRGAGRTPAGRARG